MENGRLKMVNAMIGNVVLAAVQGLKVTGLI
jgi:hypothetical protein